MKRTIFLAMCSTALLVLACQGSNSSDNPNGNTSPDNDVQAHLTHQQKTLEKYMKEADENAVLVTDPQAKCRIYNTLVSNCGLVTDLGHPQLGEQCREQAVKSCQSHGCVWNEHHCISQQKNQQQESVNGHMRQLEEAVQASNDANTRCRHFDRIHQSCELSNKMQLTHHFCNDSIDLCKQQAECTWNGTHCVHK